MIANNNTSSSINNRYFQSCVEAFYKSHRNELKLQFPSFWGCDVDSLKQLPFPSKCTCINQINDFELFGDKYTYYRQLCEMNQTFSANNPYLLVTYLNPTSSTQFEESTYWIVKPRNDYGRNEWLGRIPDAYS